MTRSLPNPFISEPAATSSLAETPAASARLKCGDAAGPSTPLGGTATAPGMARGSDSFSFLSPSSFATGMSCDRANAGGDHEEHLSDLTEADTLIAAPAVETTSLRAEPAKLNTCRTGTGPGTSGPERDVFGAPISADESRFVLDVDAFMAAIIAPTRFITLPGKASFSKA